MATASSASDDDVNQHPTAPTGQLPKPMLARQRDREEADRTGNAPPPKASYFPLGYKEAASQWWASLTPAVCEHKIMSFIPYLQKPPTVASTGSEPNSKSTSMMSVDKSGATSVDDAAIRRTTSVQDPFGPRQWQSEMVQLKGNNRYLNEFSVERLGEEVDHSLVMLHGYGAGLGFFYKNFEGLSRLPNWKLYALDMLGMGRSSRPSFNVVKAKDREGRAREAESWFVDALEEWRLKRGIDKFTLMGHSLGGYMAVCYALKYPGHLNKLILASPVGIPEDPYAVNDDASQPESSTMQNEFAQSGDETAQRTQNQPPKRKMPWWLTSLWDANISPFSLVRLTGPIGPRLVSGWTSRRFSHLPAEESQALHDYSYSLFRQRGSGEYALAHVLAPGAYARSPLIRRIQGVGRQFLQPHAETLPDNAASKPVGSVPGADAAAAKVRETGVPVVFMYGENDWMDVKGGHASVEKMNAEKRRALAQASEEERQRENGDYKVSIIRKAGHHVYLDGWEQFNSEILDEMKDVERREKRLAALQQK